MEMHTVPPFGMLTIGLWVICGTAKAARNLEYIALHTGETKRSNSGRIFAPNMINLALRFYFTEKLATSLFK